MRRIFIVRRGARSGVTIIELLVATLSATVLALTAGIILVYCFRTLRSNGDAVGLQRDVDITTRTLYRAIRSTRRAQIDATKLPVGGTGTQLTIDTRSYYRAAANRLPSPTGSFLVYDPNTGASGDEQVLVNGTLQSCTFTHLTNSIGLAFTVVAKDDTIIVDTGNVGIHMRNEL